MHRAGWVALSMLVGCGGSLPEPALDRLRQPTGLAPSPDGRWLFVTNGNWDLEERAGTLMVLDLVQLHAELAAGDCEAGDDVELACEEAPLVADALVLGDGLGNVAVDEPAGAGGPLRLLLPQRAPAAVVWVDVQGGGEPRLECGQTATTGCDDVHVLRTLAEDPTTGLPRDPARVVLDREGYRFAYVPHLLEATLSLVALDGERGPEITDIQGEFFAADPFDIGIAGGFGVAQRICDPADPPTASRDCTRPYLYSTHRYAPALRAFTVRPGEQQIDPGGNIGLDVANPGVVESQPFMADLAFEDPEQRASLLVLQTAPPTLARVDTTLDENGAPHNDVIGTVSLCENPNHLVVHRPEGAEPLALVTCFDDGLVAVVGLGSFRLLTTIEVGAGPNEIAIDVGRQQAYVADTRSDTISIISLDRASPSYLRRWATIGR
jgi:hypothetical protein